jgi:hypothetical protein
LPAEWTKPGMVTRLNGIATPFGKLTIKLEITRDAKSAKLHVEPLSDPSCTKIVIHLYGWASPEKNAVREFDPAGTVEQTVSLDCNER